MIKDTNPFTYTMLSFKDIKLRAGEMVQQFRALAALPEDPGSIPSTLIAAHNCL